MATISNETWSSWVRGVYGTPNGRLFIQQLFRICGYCEPTRIKLEKHMTEREILALLEVCHKIMQGLSQEQIADIIKSIQRKGED